MALRIEDYALIGDMESVALVGVDGSMDWLCLPRFDSGACFAALLGTPEHGRWLLAPEGAGRCSRRAYRDGTLVLETEWETDEGAVTVVDCMTPRDERPNVVRLVIGRRGRVRMRTELVVRFDYGSIVPWVTSHGGDLVAIGGPDAVVLHSPLPLQGRDLTSVAEFEVPAGDVVPFALTWFPSHEAVPHDIDPEEAVEDAEAWWRDWADRSGYRGRWREAVQRSLVTLKALTYAPTGGIVAAATTSLPESVGGVRNWDYRLCWLRDATHTLLALLASGYVEEADAWRTWLLRSVAGDPSRLQIMYGPAGERRLTEHELDWLPGYEGSAPVRIGNAATDQLQLDVYGEVLDAMHQARRAGLASESAAWDLERALLECLELIWEEPDEGIWEVRSQRRHFTHSKVMAWVAFDRAVASAEQFGLPGPVEHWRAVRDRIHAQVCERGFDPRRGTFVQAYDRSDLDASLLMLPLVGFLPADDPRMVATIEAIERELTVDGFVRRYDTQAVDDGLPPGEGVFLMCTFWLVDCLALAGRHDDAVALFERLLALRNDVGLLAEEYDPQLDRQLGNFPQAFSHVGLINAARTLADRTGRVGHERTTTSDGYAPAPPAPDVATAIGRPAPPGAPRA